MGLDLGIRTGEDAARMARTLRQYLRHPDKLFRRVRDQHGNLRLSKAAKAYHPGRGVYRSSYRNARRLAVTETNIAYHTADHLRWQQMDFVVGIEIRLSGNHTVNGLPLTDICDTLAGRYPKDFKFTGWHPHCRCHAVTVLKTEKEMAEDTRRILAGEEPLKGSVNTVRDVPDAFGKWVEANADRIEAAEERGTTPYFIRDNRDMVKRIMECKAEDDADRARQTNKIEATAKRVEEVANIIINNGYHSSREAQMPPLDIGSVSSAIIDYADRNHIDLESHDLYITTKAIEHTLREGKVAKGIAVEVAELVDFVKNRDDYAVYYDPAMGDFIYATSKAKFIVRPNYKMKINKEKKSVFNYISATRISNSPEDAFRYFVKIKDAKQR